MTIVQVCIYFNYLLLNYLNATFEAVYITGVVSAGAEIASYIFSGIMFEKLGVRRTYFLSMGIAILGGLLILFYGLDH